MNTVREAALVCAIAAPPPRGTIPQLGLGGDLTPMMTSNTAKEPSPRESATGVDLMQTGIVDERPLITHSVMLDDAHSGFALANDRSKAMKVHIQHS